MTASVTSLPTQTILKCPSGLLCGQKSAVLEQISDSSHLSKGSALAAGQGGFACTKPCAPFTLRPGDGSSAVEDLLSSCGSLDAGFRAHCCCRNVKSKDISWAYVGLFTAALEQQ